MGSVIGLIGLERPSYLPLNKENFCLRSCFNYGSNWTRLVRVISP